MINQIPTVIEIEADMKEGQKRAWMVLQVLSGSKKLSEVTQEMNISITRYYQLEEKAIRALVLSLLSNKKPLVISRLDRGMTRRDFT